MTEQVGDSGTVTTALPVDAVRGLEAEYKEQWLTLFKGLYGVLLSVTLGVFAASGVPGVLSKSDNPTEVWIILALVSAIAAFDSWYQFSLHGDQLKLGNPPGGGVSALLIVGVVVNSFLPFCFLARTMEAPPDIGYQSLNFLLAMSLGLTGLVQASFIFLAYGQSNSELHETNFKDAALRIGIARTLFSFIVIVVGLTALRSTNSIDTIYGSITVASVWIATRVVETILSIFVRPKEATDPPDAGQEAAKA